MKTKIKYFINFISGYNRIFLKVLLYEAYYSFKYNEFVPKIKKQKNNFATDTVPCIYYFLHEISNFIKNEKITSIVDLGSGFGRVVNFLSKNNKIKSYGIEFDKEVFKKSLIYKKKNVKL